MKQDPNLRLASTYAEKGYPALPCHSENAEKFDPIMVTIALEYIDANDYKTWIKIGKALRSTGEDSGLAIFDEWSQTSPKYNEVKLRKKWQTFDEDGGIGLETLFTLAREGGWQGQGSGKQQIAIGNDELETNNAAIKVLALQENIFQHGFDIVEIIRDIDSTQGKLNSKKPVRIVPLAPARLREILSNIIDWTKSTKKEKLTFQPTPDRAVDGIRSRKHWPELRQLAGCTEVPLVRRDGSILLDEGYDPQTQFFFKPNFDLKKLIIKDKKHFALKAKSRLMEVFEDFPFESPEDKSSFLAALLTPFLQHAYDGSIPFFLITANIQGAGKTLLVNLISLIYSGRDIACIAYPNSEDELRKKITALLLGGDQLVLFDNLRSILGGNGLHIALSGRTWSDRKLGKSEDVKRPLNLIWYGTGNNVIPDSDMMRRTLPIKLNTPEERPQNRDNFRHRNIRSFIKRDRENILSAIYTIIRSYFAAGAPSFDKKNWGTFDEWSDIVRNVILWLGMPDPYNGVAEFAEEVDLERQDADQFLNCLARRYPNRQQFTVIDLLSASKNNLACSSDEMQSAVVQFAAIDKITNLNARILGKKMAYIKGKVINGRRLRKGKKSNTGIKWYVESLNE